MQLEKVPTHAFIHLSKSMVNGSYKKTSNGVERRKACGDCSGGMAR